jgi:hypothetical protein
MASYSSLATLMARYPETMIVRTFSELNKKNLLYYQAEIVNLERELHEIEEEDRQSDLPLCREYDTKWSSLTQQSKDNNSRIVQGLPVQHTREGLQWEVFLKIRRLLFEYSKHTTASMSRRFF